VGREPSITIADLLVQAKITNRLLAAQLRSQMKQNELVALLATTGATIKEIAEVVDTTSATVTTTLARMKKRLDETSQMKERNQLKGQRLLPGM
jgi:DNA-directed RNA polymerase specialized sigma24 family protein